MSGQDLVNALREQRIKLIDCVTAMKEAGREYAKAEYAYKIALRKEIFYLHEEKGVAWTACTALAHGEDGENKVAYKRYLRDASKVIYETAIEAINACKLEIRLLENEIKEERGMA